MEHLFARHRAPARDALSDFAHTTSENLDLFVDRDARVLVEAECIAERLQEATLGLAVDVDCYCRGGIDLAAQAGASERTDHVCGFRHCELGFEECVGLGVDARAGGALQHALAFLGGDHAIGRCGGDHGANQQHGVGLLLRQLCGIESGRRRWRRGGQGHCAAR